MSQRKVMFGLNSKTNNIGAGENDDIMLKNNKFTAYAGALQCIGRHLYRLVFP